VDVRNYAEADGPKLAAPINPMAKTLFRLRSQSMIVERYGLKKLYKAWFAFEKVKNVVGFGFRPPNEHETDAANGIANRGRHLQID
jgi:hypothetical protein